MTELTDDALHRKVTRASLFTRAFALFAGVSLLLLLLVTAFIVVQIRHQQVQSAGTLKSASSAAQSAKDTADAIHSCVTPGLPCFEQAQRQTAGVVASIGRTSVAAAACASTLPHPTYRAVYRCVVITLAQKGKP